MDNFGLHLVFYSFFGLTCFFCGGWVYIVKRDGEASSLLDSACTLLICGTIIALAPYIAHMRGIPPKDIIWGYLYWLFVMIYFGAVAYMGVLGLKSKGRENFDCECAPLVLIPGVVLLICTYLKFYK